jgi:deoxyribonuclease-1
MRLSVGLLLLSLSVFAAEVGPNQTIGNGQLAYYGTFNPSTATKEQLFEILNGTHRSVVGRPDALGTCNRGERCYRQTPVGYSQARIIMFGELFVEQDRAGTFVTDVYCEEKVYFKKPTDISGMSNVVNIEHTWPQSKFSSQFDRNMQKEDMHHLFPTNSRANAIRGNFDFGQASGRQSFLGGELDDCEISQINEGADGRFFTPPAEHRGNTARAMFYFSVRYKMPISRAQEQVLRSWHRADPVDDKERERSSRIADYQLVRNPFVDFPQLVDRIADF